MNALRGLPVKLTTVANGEWGSATGNLTGWDDTFLLLTDDNGGAVAVNRRFVVLVEVVK